MSCGCRERRERMRRAMKLSEVSHDMRINRVIIALWLACAIALVWLLVTA